MSGFVGIVNLDAAPINPRLLQRMTNSLSFRGPDAKETWINGQVGFGHTLLKTTFESERERQPFTLDGKVWIIADARVDARTELIGKLAGKGRVPASDTTDIELILHAYFAWGEDCVEHLLGDFAFAIWDGPERRLFCARDQMGVKPFYYAHIGPVVVFSNTLDCVRWHPAVSDRLNDLAIADFLILEGNQDPATTAFADIQRLAAAHRATWSGSGLRLSRYWTLPVDEPLFYRRAGDYPDRFRELLGLTVADRVRTRLVGILMSGGFDSTTVAAAARDLRGANSGPVDLKAFTHATSFGPDEIYYAKLVADRLGIPLHRKLAPREIIDLEWERKQFHTPEPVTNPWEVPALQQSWREISAQCRVLFTGDGPDNGLYFEWRPYINYLTRHHRYGRILRDLFAVATQGQIPFWRRIKRRFRQSNSGWQWQRNFPSCLNPDLEHRLGLRTRFEQRLALSSPAHPIRPQGYASLLLPNWQWLFASLDAGWTGVPIEFRFPFLDLRMLRFLLAVPALPWCRSKYLLRRAMQGVLPPQVLNRPKTGVSVASTSNRLVQLATLPLVPTPELSYYVAIGQFHKSNIANVWSLGDSLRVRCLNNWLHNYRTAFKISSPEDLEDEHFA